MLWHPNVPLIDEGETEKYKKKNTLGKCTGHLPTIFDHVRKYSQLVTFPNAQTLTFPSCFAYR